MKSCVANRKLKWKRDLYENDIKRAPWLAKKEAIWNWNEQIVFGASSARPSARFRLSILELPLLVNYLYKSLFLSHRSCKSLPFLCQYMVSAHSTDSIVDLLLSIIWVSFYKRETNLQVFSPDRRLY